VASHIISGGTVRKKQRYDDEKTTYIVHPSEWRHMDSHLKMILLIWLRGYRYGKRSRFTWDKVECQTGESQKTMSHLFKESITVFPEWYRRNFPPPEMS